MKARIWSMFKRCWLICSIGVLLFTIGIYDGTLATQNTISVMHYGMLFLCAPVAPLISIVVVLIGFFLNEVGIHIYFVIPTNYPTFVIEWLVFFVVGYVQWFVLLPCLWHKWKARQASAPLPEPGKRGLDKPV